MRKWAPLICLILLVSCSSKKVERDGGDLTRSEVEFLSAKMAAAIDTEFPLLKHKLVNHFVDSLGQSIVSRNPDMPPLPYEFRVLKSNEVLVFSLPGGIIYVTLGTLRAVELEGQLAAAIAHELAHQQLNHPLIEWRRKVNANRGQRYLLDFDGDWRERFLGPAGALHLDKGLEEEADRLTPVVLYRAQFDPRLHVSYLQVLKKLEATDRERVGAMQSLHPPVVDRINWVKQELVRLPPLRDPRLSSPAFQELKLILKETEKLSVPPKQKKKKEAKHGKS